MNTPVYDYTPVDNTCLLEQKYEQQLEQSRASVQFLTRSVNALRNRHPS